MVVVAGNSPGRGSRLDSGPDGKQEENDFNLHKGEIAARLRSLSEPKPGICKPICKRYIQAGPNTELEI